MSKSPVGGGGGGVFPDPEVGGNGKANIIINNTTSSIDQNMKAIVSNGGIGSGSGLVTKKKMNIVRMTLLFVGMTVAGFVFYNCVFPSTFLPISLYDYTGTTSSQARQLIFCHQSNSNIQTPLDHVLIPILFYFSFGGVIIPILTPACSALPFLFNLSIYDYIVVCFLCLSLWMLALSIQLQPMNLTQKGIMLLHMYARLSTVAPFTPLGHGACPAWAHLILCNSFHYQHYKGGWLVK